MNPKNPGSPLKAPKPKSKWDTNHYVYQCSDGPHNSFWATVTQSPQWQAWEKDVSHRVAFADQTKPIPNVWDVDECRECGWISPEHFQAFLAFCKGKG